MKEGNEQFTTIDEYIRTFPEEVQVELEKMKKAIQEASPEATEWIKTYMIFERGEVAQDFSIKPERGHLISDRSNPAPSTTPLPIPTKTH